MHFIYQVLISYHDCDFIYNWVGSCLYCSGIGSIIFVRDLSAIYSVILYQLTSTNLCRRLRMGSWMIFLLNNYVKSNVIVTFSISIYISPIWLSGWSASCVQLKSGLVFKSTLWKSTIALHIVKLNAVQLYISWSSYKLVYVLVQCVTFCRVKLDGDSSQIVQLPLGKEVFLEPWEHPFRSL